MVLTVGNKRTYGSGTVVAARGGDKKKGPFIGYLRRVINGRRYKSPTFAGTKRRDVEMQLRNWNREDQNGRDGFGRMIAEHSPQSALFTVYDYLQEWFPRAKHAWRETTIGTHTSTFNTWLVRDEVFNAVPLKDVEKTDVQAFFDRLPSKTSARTRHRIHALLHQAFQAAVTDDRLPGNVAQTSTKPKKPRAKTVEEVPPKHEALLMAHVDADRYWNALILLALDSGMREAEILGLQVREVDFERRKVRIRRTCNTIPGKGPVVVDLAKTEDSIRDIELYEATLDALRGLCEAKDSLDHVFTNAGALWTRSAFYDAWTARLKQAGLPHYHFHALRHTCATALLRDGMYLTAVSRRLGHSKPSVTLDLYSSFLPTDQAALVRSFGERLARNRSQPFAKDRKIGTKIGTDRRNAAA